MKSYTQGRNLYGVWTKNTDTTNLSYGDQMANDDYRHLCAMRDWPWLERRRSLTTLASTQFYNLPYDTDLVREVSFAPTGSSMLYTLSLVPDRKSWDLLNLSTYTSDTPQYYFVFNGQIGVWPTPTSAGSTIYIAQKCRVVDLAAADYTIGSITTSSTTAGVTTLTGSGTTWTGSMVGRYIRITASDAAPALTGDGLWYEIASVASTTSLTLVRAYGGTTIAAATAAYTIGQMPLLPEAFHDLPWQWAAGTYWQKEADKRADTFFAAHGQPGNIGQAPTGRVKELISAYSSPTTDLIIDSGDDGDTIINPNLTIRL